MRTSTLSAFRTPAADEQKTLSEKVKEVNRRSSNPYPK